MIPISAVEVIAIHAMAKSNTLLVNLLLAPLTSRPASGRIPSLHILLHSSKVIQVHLLRISGIIAINLTCLMKCAIANHQICINRTLIFRIRYIIYKILRYFLVSYLAKIMVFENGILFKCIAETIIHTLETQVKAINRPVPPPTSPPKPSAYLPKR